MTGGKIDDRQRHWDDSEIEGLRKIKEDTIARLAELGSINMEAEYTLQAQSESLTRQLEASRDEKEAMKKNLEDRKKEEDYHKQQVAIYQPQLAQLEQALAQLKQQREQANALISQVEDEIFRDFCARLNLPNIREYEKQQGALQAEAAQKRLEFENQINRLTNSLIPEEEALRSVQDRLDKFKREIERDKDTIKDLEETMQIVTEERNTLMDELEALKEQLAERQEEISGIQEKLMAQKKEVGSKQSALGNVQKKIAELEAEVELMSTRKYDLLRKCKLDGITIPLEPNSAPLDDLPIEDAIAPQDDPDAMDVDEDPNSGLNGTAEIQDYGIRPDFKELDDDLKDVRYLYLELERNNVLLTSFLESQGREGRRATARES